MKDIEHHQTMRAELAPDVYAGEQFDQIAHQWKTSCDGDMGDSGTLDTITLDANMFPPGTKVIVEEPLCPDCKETRAPGDGAWLTKCNCGFDWEAWTIDQYS
jgi:hypothetical protein